MADTCCPMGEAAGVQVCPECAEISAAYSAAMDPRPTLDQCRCPMRARLLGDGCEHCNPQLAEELRRENEEGAKNG